MVCILTNEAYLCGSLWARVTTLSSTLEVSLTSGDQHASCGDWRGLFTKKRKVAVFSSIPVFLIHTYLGKVNKW
jgi:hypothetical protein